MIGTIARGSALALALTLAVAAAPVAQAQDFSLSPTFGSVNLSAGFANDPYTVSMTAGGSIDASRSIGGGCNGFVASAPDYRLNYSAGGFALSIFATSGSDTTLVVNAPDGRWYCNDDHDGLNPLVRFASPMSGQYDIWVGTFGSSMAPATLGITELR